MLEGKLYDSRRFVVKEQRMHKLQLFCLRSIFMEAMVYPADKLYANQYIFIRWIETYPLDEVIGSLNMV